VGEGKGKATHDGLVHVHLALWRGRVEEVVDLTVRREEANEGNGIWWRKKKKESGKESQSSLCSISRSGREVAYVARERSAPSVEGFQGQHDGTGKEETGRKRTGKLGRNRLPRSDRLSVATSLGVSYGRRLRKFERRKERIKTEKTHEGG
jgi:hypothetical protein